MSAIRIRPAGSTVSYHPCLFTHHFNVEKNIWDQPKMLHHARVVLALGGWRGWAVGWYVSPPALCCTSAPLSNPSISCGLNFPPFPLLLSFHFLLSLFPTSRLWLSLPRREPDSSSPHPSRSKWKLSAQLFSSHSTWLWLRHGRVTRMPLFLPLPLRLSCRLLFLHLLIKNNNLCHACLLPPTVCDLYVCRCAFVVFLSLHQPLLTICRFPPPSLSPISSAAQSGSSMLKDLKAIISEKKSQQGFLSYQIWLVSFEHILSSNPSFPWRSHGFLFVRPKQVFSSNKHDFWII